MRNPNRFTSYETAVARLHSIGGHVSIRKHAAVDHDEVSAFDPETSLTRLAAFDAGVPGSSQYERDRQEAVRLACCDLYVAGLKAR